MDVIFYSLVIVGCLLFLKLVIIVWVYVCRAKRLHNQDQQEIQQNRDAHLYPASPHNPNTPFVNFEEVPQPVLSVAPGESPQGLHPQMLPPPYSVHDKPPAYTEIYKEDGSSGQQQQQQQQEEEVVDHGTECMDSSRMTTATAAAAVCPPPPSPPPPPQPSTYPATTPEEERHATVSAGGGIAIV